MQYLGGKSRIAKPISALLLAAKGERTTYVEPFLGGGSVAALTASGFERAVLADAMPDLALMWRAVLEDGWTPPGDISPQEWEALREAEPSPLRAVAGFGCSFGGMWFSSYAVDPRKRCSFAETAARGLARKAAGMRGAEVRLADYRELDDVIDAASVVYCDPPYAGTATYKGVEPFDSARFWKTAEQWAEKGAAVFVSEYAAPAPWVSVWEAERRSILSGADNRSLVTERLFAL